MKFLFFLFVFGSLYSDITLHKKRLPLGEFSYPCCSRDPDKDEQ